MSNEYEFKVHNFYNYTLEELKELKQEFKDSVSEFCGLYESAVEYKKAYEDLDNELVLKFIKAFDNIFEACDYMIGIANANRKPRAKKIKSPEQLVAKMQFKTADDKMNLTSIDPAEIIYAEELWVYNTKTRKYVKKA